MPTIADIRSTKHHRDNQRASVASALIGSTLSKISPSATLPTSIAQIIVSGHSLWKGDAKPFAAAINVSQGLLAALNMALTIVLLFENDECSDLNGVLCKLLLISEFAYQGTVLAGWAPAELVRETQHP